jgi:hypothetical protein
MDLPPLSDKPILHIDMTPNEDLPIRILETYLQNAKVKWQPTYPNPVLEKMNEDQDKRIEILTRAIAKLQARSVRLVTAQKMAQNLKHWREFDHHNCEACEEDGVCEYRYKALQEGSIGLEEALADYHKDLGITEPKKDDEEGDSGSLIR